MKIKYNILQKWHVKTYLHYFIYIHITLLPFDSNNARASSVLGNLH